MTDQFPSSVKLAHVVEECGEVLFWAGKIGRFGWESPHPKYNNEPCYSGLYRELADLQKRVTELKEDIERYEFYR